MARFAAMIVPALLLVAATGVAMAASRLFALGVGEAIAVGLGVLFAFALAEVSLQRLRDRRRLARRLQEITLAEDMLTRRLGSLASRLDALQRKDRDRAEDAQSSGAGVSALLVGQLAEAVAALDRRLDRLEERRSDRAMPPAAARPATREPARRDDPPLRDSVKSAISARRFDFTLQPIVTLPQRRPRYYELFLGLRDESGAPIPVRDAEAAAATLGLQPVLDRAIWPTAVEVLQRLSGRQRDVGVFCSLSLATLSDGGAFSELLAFATAHRPFADGLFFTLSQPEFGRLGQLEIEGLGALSDLGFRFAMDRATDLRASFQALAARRFRFVKAPAGVLLGSGRKGHDIAPADMAAMIARFGLDLIVDHVDTEAEVLELLDYKVTLAQGAVLGPARPVRADPVPGVAAAQ